MMAGSLWATLRAWCAWCAAPGTAQPTRVGMLNTGELILVGACGQAQVITAATTARIREQLMHSDFADSELVLFPPVPPASHIPPAPPMPPRAGDAK